MAFVYWIRKPEHVDMFSEGYVGVTRKTVEERFVEHKHRAATKAIEYSNISRAIQNYGAENLIVSTILSADTVYCFEVELKLRPEPFIGWNMSVGGGPAVVGYVPTEQKKLNHSEFMKKWWKDNPDHDHSNKGRPGKKVDFTEEWRQKIVDGKFYNLPFRSPWWAKAEFYYEDYLSGLTHTIAQKKNNLKPGQLFHMWKRFKSGWNPNEDLRWKDTLKRYLEEANNGS